MRIGVILVTSLVLTTMAGGALMASTGRGGYQPITPEAAPADQLRRVRFAYDQTVIDLGHYPLDWDCHRGSEDRARYFQSACFATHLAEFTLTEGRGSVQLSSLGEARFQGVSVMNPVGTNPLTDLQTDRIRQLLQKRLPEIPARTDGFARMPMSTSAIEACIDGKAWVLVSHDDAKDFEALTHDLLRESGLSATRSSPGRCY